ncbi:hypothetical protein RDI58_014752 [Solanum bulbocastanum]|uniref:DUF7081 domain-containing protein n=1 Tax=Solanum bulbocastanum TaxID=147425 RepID=A0AAN8TJ75_SOLBU
MSAKEEVGESLALVVYNGSASTINETGFQLYPVSEYDSGEGLPYDPVDWPNVGDNWMIPSKQSPSSKDIDFGSDKKDRTTSSGTKMQFLLSDSPFGAITCKAGN